MRLRKGSVSYGLGADSLHDGLWLFTVASSSSRVFSAMEGGAMNTCLHVLKEPFCLIEELITSDLKLQLC